MIYTICWGKQEQEQQPPPLPGRVDLAKFFFRIEGEIKFSRQDKAEEFITTTPALQEMLKGVFKLK